MKFKLPIKVKIVALGAVLSILVSAAALIFSNSEYRRRGKEKLVDDIDSWLDNMVEVLQNETSGKNYPEKLKSFRDYALQQYETFPDDPEPGLSYDKEKLFYKDRFKWMYAIEGLAMYHMTAEEIAFRADYEEFLFLLSDAKAMTKANLVYLSYINDDNTLFYLGDSYSYKITKKEDPYLPGSRRYNLVEPIERKGRYCDCFYDGKMCRVTPLTFNSQVIAYLFVEYDYNQINADPDSLLSTEILALSITSIVMIVAYALGAHFLMIRNITKLTRSASAFSDDLTSGEPLEVKDPKVKSRDEIRVLSDSFVTLEGNIIKYVDVIQKEAQEKERMEAEMNIATNIQLSALPSRNYDDKNVSLRAFIKSAKEVGGDFYDYFYIDDNRLVILISDVSGKGVPAALFMMKSKELIKSSIHKFSNLVDAVAEVNNILTRNNKESLFVTSFIGVIDFSMNTITYVNAGHEKPYIISGDKLIKLEGTSNFVMGGEENFPYRQESHAFNKGDYIFLFTDGLNESINSEREEFSYQRIENTLEENKSLTLDKLIDKMNENLEAFVGNEEQFDDVTMLVIKYRKDELRLHYEQKDYNIITDIVDHFNESFAYLPVEPKGACGIIIDELVNNLISYEPREDLIIDIDISLNKKGLLIVVTSNGNDYNPFDNHKDKYLEEFSPDIKEGGFGLSIIKDLSSSYDYEYKNNRSVVTVVVPVK